ncbi:EutN/CcmL family microcompartment protein [Amylibacter sp.]|jgi:ethanolamine utilization protein EutN|nr:EutN/CcmL family microcompartment protein [Amylibacter sp.]
MKLARVTGTVTATAKDAQLVGATLLVCDIIDGAGKVVIPAEVAADTVGAGVGDTVLMTTGSAARMAAGTSGAPINAAIIAVVDQVTLAK